MNRISAVAALASSLGIALLAPSRANAQTAAPGAHPIATITATGHATESRDPDQAEVMLGMQATGKTSADAQDALNTAMDKVIKAVKETGLPGMTVQTLGLSLYPTYESEGQGRRTSAPKIIGYRASNTIRASCSDVTKVGKVVDAAVAAGANQILGISFTLKNDGEARREAMRRATMDAKAKAQAIAGALGVELGRVVQATAGGAQVIPMRYRGGMEVMAAADAAVAPTPVEAGQVQVSGEVTVEFAIVENK